MIVVFINAGSKISILDERSNVNHFSLPYAFLLAAEFLADSAVGKATSTGITEGFEFPRNENPLFFFFDELAFSLEALQFYLFFQQFRKVVAS